MSDSRQVDQAIARFDEVMGRIDRTDPARDARARDVSRGTAAYAQRLANIGLALGHPDRRHDRLRPDRRADRLRRPVPGGEPRRARRAGARPLGWPARSRSSIIRKTCRTARSCSGSTACWCRSAPPCPPPRRARSTRSASNCRCSNAGSAETAILDPLAQDARRLMGKHLPELIERYERVPAAYRAERDGEGLTVDERLVQGLDAAKTALDDLGRKLAHEDLDAFETQGRFIESRYKDGEDSASRPNKMAFELERILYETEDFLRRSLGSSSRREAKKRKAQRQARRSSCAGVRARRPDPRRAARRADRSPASSSARIGFFTWLVALPTVFFDRPDLDSSGTRAGRGEAGRASARRPALPLAELAARAEEGLLDRCRELPGRAQGAADAILARLAELQPHLGASRPQFGAGRRRAAADRPASAAAGRFLSRASGERPRARLGEQPALHRKPFDRRRTSSTACSRPAAATAR